MHSPHPKSLASACLALLLGLSVPAALQAAGAPAPLEFTAATYNLRLDTPDDGPNAWAHRRDAVRALVRYHGIELMGTQEGLMNQINDLAAMPGFAWVGVGRDDGKDGGEHSAIFYRSARFELLAHGDYWLSATPDVPSRSWDSRCCNRLATWARLRERRSGREFYVFSVHFDHEAEVSRRESAKLMLRKIKEIAGEAPTVILGDFNATPDSEPVRIMTSAMRDGRKESETPPYGPEGTFNDFKLDVPPERRIDYVFLTPRWRVLSYAALTDNVEARYPSDHLPVVARLRLD
jgi:endonuclease/exonuclease/phosphatase family metal-dependent hydrolase